MWTLGRRGGSDVTGGERQNIVTLSAGRGSAWPGRRRWFCLQCWWESKTSMTLLQRNNGNTAAVCVVHNIVMLVVDTCSSNNKMHIHEAEELLCGQAGDKTVCRHWSWSTMSWSALTLFLQREMKRGFDCTRWDHRFISVWHCCYVSVMVSLAFLTSIQNTRKWI